AHTSVKDLEQSILDYLARHNEKPRPFVWRKTADQIIGAVGRAAEKLI
ncbi:MAG: IS630 family transposase, partial [Rhodanobacteraceae bacterium]|nr:IS630 family transposase [Rhodanobacteraceae bacterium]